MNISGGDPSKEETSFELLVYSFQMAFTSRSWKKIKGNSRNQDIPLQPKLRKRDSYMVEI